MTEDDGSDGTEAGENEPSENELGGSGGESPEPDGTVPVDEGSETELRGNWTDRIVGERMAVDREFSEKVAASNFSNQQWGLIMTAVEFEIEDPDDPDRARLVVDTSKIESILPELERMENASGMGAMGGMTGGGRSRSGGGESSGSSGLFDDVKRVLGLDGTETDREQLAAAEEMAQMYADDLQETLESRGKWELIVAAARE